MPDIPDLIIPVRMDMDKALAALAKIGGAGKKAGDDVEAGGKKGQEGLEGMGSGADEATTKLLALAQAQLTFASFKMAIGAVADEYKRVSDYVKEMASQFISLQKILQSLAAISGKPNENQFVVEEIKKAEAANLTPTEWADFRTKYMAKASMYIGDKKTAKLTDKDSEELEAAAAEFAKGKGISAGIMADTVGGMLAQEKGKTTGGAMLSKLGRVYNVLESASTDPQNLLGGMTRLMALGFSAEGAGATLAQLPEIAPGEEGTYAMRTTMELNEQLRAGKIGAKQGLREGMDPREQLKAVTKYLEDEMKKGTTEEEKKKILGRAVGEITKEAITTRTLVGLASQGTAAMEGWEALVSGAPADAVQQSIIADRKSSAGVRRHHEAGLAAEQAKVGAERAGVDTLKLEAETQLTRERRFDQGNMIEDIARGAISGLTKTDVRQQLINQRALQIEQERLGLNRPEAELTDEEAQLKAETNFSGVAMGGAADQMLKRLVDFEEAKMKKAEAKPGAPLTVPTPKGGGASVP